MPWPEIFGALREINYQGAVVMEPFLVPGGEVGRDISVFRDLLGNGDLDEEAAHSVQFVRSELKKHVRYSLRSRKLLASSAGLSQRIRLSYERNEDFIHKFVPGTSGRTLILLHGTGGTESDLLDLGRALDPEAALLSPRGKVLENGMPRFFRRLAEGVFDEEDLDFSHA